MATSIKASRSDSTKKPARNVRKALARADELSRRVQAVGLDKFAFVCVDPAKARSRWMMTDFFGKPFIEPSTVEHVAGQLRAAVALVQTAVREHGLGEVQVLVERTGNYHRPVQLAFAQAFPVLMMHPFHTKQFRQVVSPGVKTDDLDLLALRQAGAANIGVAELPLDEPYRTLQLLVRQRRDLVEKTSLLQCQCRERLELCLPGYAALFGDLWFSAAGVEIARSFPSAAAIVAVDVAGLALHIQRKQITIRGDTLEQIVAWAREAPAVGPDAPFHHQVWLALDDDRQTKERLIQQIERDCAARLVDTPYIRLLMVPGINMISAAELAGELGPITRYAHSGMITGRGGLYPSCYQSDDVDHPDGPLVRRGNRRVRAILMRIADNLIHFNAYFRTQAARWRKQEESRDRPKTAKERRRKKAGIERRLRVRVAKHFSRLLYAWLQTDDVPRHPCCSSPDTVCEKLLVFHQEHHSTADALQTNLLLAVLQLPDRARDGEAATVREELKKRRRGTLRLNEILPQVLLRLLAPRTPKVNPATSPTTEANLD